MKNIFVAGGHGMVGSAIVRALSKKKLTKVFYTSRKELNLEDQAKVTDYFKKNEIDEVYICAAHVGGIQANNDYPVDFLLNNLKLQNSLIESCFKAKITKLLFLGSSCIYPRLSDQPIQEKSLLNGHLEKTNEPYAIAKIAGIKLCESFNRQYGMDYRSVMPTNLYGYNDYFHPTKSHVIPGLIQRFNKAKQNNISSVEVWGTGKIKREFLFVDDLANACVFLMSLDKKEFYGDQGPQMSHLNIGFGSDVTIKELAEKIAEVVDYKGQIIFDPNKLEGTPKKLLDSTRLFNLGWKHENSLEIGLKKTYKWFLEQHDMGNIRI